MADMTTLDGKIAFVVGASADIGKAIAWELANEGAKVAIGASTEARWCSPHRGNSI